MSARVLDRATQDKDSEADLHGIELVLRMICDGPSIKNQSELVKSTSRAALSISQLLMFNSVKSIGEVQILVMNDIIGIVKHH